MERVCHTSMVSHKFVCEKYRWYLMYAFYKLYVANENQKEVVIKEFRDCTTFFFFSSLLRKFDKQ